MLVETAVRRRLRLLSQMRCIDKPVPKKVRIAIDPVHQQFNPFAMIEDPSAVQTALSHMKLALEAGRSLFGLLTEFQQALPDSDDKDAISEAIGQTEKQFAIAEAELALALGYKLCKCAFPPAIMLENAAETTAEASGKTLFKCPKCGRTG